MVNAKTKLTLIGYNWKLNFWMKIKNRERRERLAFQTFGENANYPSLKG